MTPAPTDVAVTQADRDFVEALAALKQEDGLEAAQKLVARHRLTTQAEPRVKEGWRPIESAPARTPLVGYNAAFDDPYWIGERYDLDPRAVINWQTGRWRRCTHFALVPKPPVMDGEGGA